MKKRSALVFFVSFTLLILLASPSSALFKSDVKKAKEFMAAGMYPQAIELLEKRISDKPTDAEAHYQLGICYINTGNYNGADERFGSAVRLKSDYGYQIGGEYKRVGSENLSKGRTNQALALFRKAVQYQPDLRKTIVKEVFDQGKSLFDQAQYGSADRRFAVAIIFDSSLGTRVCDMYYSLGQSADENNCVGYYRRTKQYCSTHNKEIGQRLLKIAKSKKEEKEVEKWRTEASNYVEVPPDYKTYPRGIHYLPTMKAGEESALYIRILGTRYDVSSPDNKFKLVFRDGDIIPAWTPGDIPNKNGSDADFKIIAVTDQPKIKLIVK